MERKAEELEERAKQLFIEGEKLQAKARKIVRDRIAAIRLHLGEKRRTARPFTVRDTFKVTTEVDSQLDAMSQEDVCQALLDRRLGVPRPAGFPFNLNSLVDTLLKREFDHYRSRGEPHPLMVKNKIEAVPFAHPELNRWRDALRAGVEYLDPDSNLVVTGGIDDVWIDRAEQLVVVDYKATAKNGEVGIDAPWQDGYKRQLEVYQWLFRRNGFQVSDTGYFVYCNGDTSREAFEARIDFKIKVIPYTGNDGWIDQTIRDIASCLNHDATPDPGPDCDYCKYRAASSVVENAS